MRASVIACFAGALGAGLDDAAGGGGDGRSGLHGAARLTSQVVGWLLITVSRPGLAAGVIGALLLIQPAGSVALRYVILD